MHTTIYQHERSPIGAPREFSAEELTKFLSEHRESTVKEGLAWSPAELAPCPTPCRNTGSTRHKCSGGELHRHNDAVVAHSCVVFDVDHITEADAAEMILRLESIGLQGVVHSSYSHNPPEDCALRVVLYPDAPIPAAQVAKVRNLLQNALAIPADPATKDLSRLYYAPTTQPGRETFAYPLQGEPFAVAALVAAPEPAQSVAASAPPGAAPNTAPVPLDVDALRDMLRRVTSPSAKEIIKNVLGGNALAPVGEHDTSLQRLAGICATYLPSGTPFDQIVVLCDTSLRLMGWEDGYEDCLRAFEEKFARAVDRVESYRAEQKRLRDALKAEIAVKVADATADPMAAESTEDGKYTQAALDAWKIDTNEWIIQKGDMYYVFVNGDYIPRMRVELPNTIHRDLARSPLMLETETAKGVAKELTPPELVRLYGSVARSVDADMGAQRGRYDPRTGIFTEAVCPLRHLVPEYDADIDRWLRLLGGENADDLLDWIATITDLTRQTCAIYLYGPSGSGKNLLAQGLARLWTTGAPTSMESAMGNFNDAISRCPLIFADEKLPDVKNITEELRTMVGSSTRELRRKYMPNATLNGAVRAIMAANNPDLLKPRNDMTEMDLRAVSERILFLPITPESSDYLKDIGGAATVNDWCFGDKIAKHALWLRDNRDVAPSKNRFLVMGKKSIFHERLAVNSGVARQVCEVLVKAIVSSKPVPPTVASLFLVGSGELLVNVNAVEALWETHIKSGERFSLDRISRALVSISNGTVRLRVDNKQSRYCRVRTEQLFAWANESGAADADELKARLEKPNPVLVEAKERGTLREKAS